MGVPAGVSARKLPHVHPTKRKEGEDFVRSVRFPALLSTVPVPPNGVQIGRRFALLIATLPHRGAIMVTLGATNKSFHTGYRLEVTTLTWANSRC